MRSLDEIRIGIALTGSFCTFKKVFDILPMLVSEGAQLFPIMSNHAYSMDTRFFSAVEARTMLEGICQRPCWSDITQVEPIGPHKLLDLLLIMPCTGNTIAKMANGIADTPVTMAAKSQMRNERPVLLGVSTNDGLGSNAANIGALLVKKHMYFVPYYQDDPRGKPCSLVFDESAVLDSILCALDKKQCQPLLRSR